MVLAASLSSSLIIGCGDDSEEATTREDYLRQGNAICVDIDKEVQEALPTFDAPPTVADVQQVATDLAPVLRSLRARVAELEPPETLDAQHHNLLDEIDSATAALVQAAQDDAKAEAFVQEGPSIEELSAAAVELGLAGCS